MNIAIINQSGSKYLFEVPESITLKEGEKVKCDTRRGVTDGIVWADSITADEPAAKLIGKLLGANFPLKTVVGKTVTSVEMFEQPKREDKPKFKVGDRAMVIGKRGGHKFSIGEIVRVRTLKSTGEVDSAEHLDGRDFWFVLSDELEPYAEPESTEPKQEPVKLYCVEENCPGGRLTKGKIYKTDASGYITYDDGTTSTYEHGSHDWKNTITGISACLVPLVSRAAKVGEWVLVSNNLQMTYGVKPGDVVFVDGEKQSPDSAGFIWGSGLSHKKNEYLVLDGYTEPEPEKAEPEYYSGKVVCVEADALFTVGKVYEFRGGLIKSNSGNIYNEGEPVSSFEDLSDGTWVPKFIEFKGE